MSICSERETCVLRWGRWKEGLHVSKKIIVTLFRRIASGELRTYKEEKTAKVLFLF